MPLVIKVSSQGYCDSHIMKSEVQFNFSTFDFRVIAQSAMVCLSVNASQDGPEDNVKLVLIVSTSTMSMFHSLLVKVYQTYNISDLNYAISCFRQRITSSYLCDFIINSLFPKVEGQRDGILP